MIFYATALNALYKQKEILKGYHIARFNTAMYTTDNYKDAFYAIAQQPDESVFLHTIRKKYNDFFRKIPWRTQPRIPKIVHQIWLGSPLPEEYYAWQKSWLEKHPTWEYKLWTDDDIAGLHLINQKFFDEAKSFGEKANILRYEILHQFGGLYVDTDFECLKLLDLFNHSCDFYAGLEYPQRSKMFFIVGNALLAARPGHPLIFAMIENIKYHWHEDEQVKRSGTHYITQIIKNHIDTVDGINMIFPANMFYPWAGREASDRLNSIKPETIAIHYWNLSWLKK